MNILRTFTTGRGWRHVLMLFALTYDLVMIGTFEAFSSGTANTIGEGFAATFVAFCLSVVIEIFQMAADGKFSWSDVFWGTGAAAAGWGLARTFPHEVLAWLCLAVMVVLVIQEARLFFRGKKFTFRLFGKRL